jgi:hypothetical protein
MLGQFRAVALQLGVFVTLFVVCVTSVADAKAPKRLALGQLDSVTAAWSITVTDCPYCLGGGQVDVASGSLTSRHVQVDVRDQRGRPVDTYGRRSPLRALSRWSEANRTSTRSRSATVPTSAKVTHRRISIR